ncbi:hypothetical protein [Brevundimonas vesicularis]|uniref:hypothetical protein n=1 Tax=Brevundimonas vesicularis TaxID=41276 RepID=UPI0038D41D94
MKTLMIAASVALMALPAGSALASGLESGQTAVTPPASTRPDGSAAPAAPAQLNTRTNTGKALMTLRQTIIGLTNESVDYSTMTPDLAAKIREQSEQITPLLRQFGPLQTAQAKGTENGAEKFRVVFANQATDWLIGFNEEGKIALLLFRPAED